MICLSFFTFGASQNMQNPFVLSGKGEMLAGVYREKSEPLNLRTLEPFIPSFYITHDNY